MASWTQLLPHPANQLVEITRIEAIARRAADTLSYRMRLYGDVGRLELPELVYPSDRRQRDELWRSTCMEAFVRADGGRDYTEFNLSPGGHWAAYRFDDRRAGMRALPVSVRIGQAYRDNEVFDMSVTFTGVGLSPARVWHVGLSMVVEGLDGTKSYWALAHPDGPPDFHDPACFVLELPAAD